MRYYFILMFFLLSLGAHSNCDSLYSAGFVQKAAECYSDDSLKLNSIGLEKCLQLIDTCLKNEEFVVALKFLIEKEPELESANADLKSQWYHKLGLGYYFLGDYSKAAHAYFESAKAYRQLDSLGKVADLYLNIGTVYGRIKEAGLSRKYLMQALVIYGELNDLPRLANAYNNLGNYYRLQYEYDSAVNYYDSSMVINDSLQNYPEMAAVLNNKGVVFDMKGDPQKALINYYESLQLNKKYGSASAVGESLLQLGSYYNANWEYDSALVYLTEARLIGEKLRSLDLLNGVYEQLTETYKSKNAYKKAFDAYQRHVLISERLNDDESVKQFAQMELLFEFDQKQQKQRFQMKQQQVFTFVALGGLAVAIIIALLIYRNFVDKKKDNELLDAQNKEIVRQRDEINEQKQEMLDSILYASRIQHAVLTSKEVRFSLFPEHFVLFKPRDVVSGDFYWGAEKDGIAYFTAADCTGHGVPGAFMSLLGVSFLNEIINYPQKLEPQDILNELRSKIINDLGQTGEEGRSKDGMDMGLVAINSETREVCFAGAYNPLYLVRDGELIEYKADRMPVSYYIRTDAFTSTYIQCQKNDIIYMFSDGFADQFGGSAGKKLKTKGFKNLIREASHMPIESQSAWLEEQFVQWRNDHEQIDDVVVVGIKL